MKLGNRWFNLFMILMLTVFGAPKTLAIRFAIPSGLPGHLFFENPSAEPIHVYQKIPIDPNRPYDGVWEVLFEVKAKGSLSREIASMLQPLQFESGGDLQISYQGPSGKIQNLSEALANNLELQSQRVGVQKLVITNFSSLPQKVEFMTKSITGRQGLQKEIELPGFGKRELDFTASIGTRVFLAGEYAIGAYIQDGLDIQFSQPRPRKLRKTDQPGKLFLLANENRTQSYIVRLTDPGQMQAAREQIANPTGWRARILIGEVSAGSNRDNQNLLSPYAPMWSWHISKVYRFAELASQACDGHPQFIEDVLPAWLGGAFNGGSKVICFWGYRIVEEL